MISRKLGLKRNKNARKVVPNDRMHRNCINISPANTVDHELRKAKECIKLRKEGKEYITEARFESGGRADIYVLDDDLAIEIAVSEGKKSIENKVESYPCEVEVLKKDGDRFIRERL